MYHPPTHPPTRTHTHAQLTVVIGIFSDVVYELRMVVRFELQGSKVTSGTTSALVSYETTN